MYNNMDCRQARDLLSAYLDNALEQGSREMLKDHLSRCEGCRKELDALQSVVKKVESLQPLQTPPDFLESLRERIDKEPESRLDKLMRLLFFPLGVKIPVQVISAAAVAVIVISIYHSMSPQDLMPTTAKERSQGKTVATDTAMGSAESRAEKTLVRPEKNPAVLSAEQENVQQKPPPKVLAQAPAPAGLVKNKDLEMPGAIELSLMVKPQAEMPAQAKAEMAAKSYAGAMNAPAAPKMAYEAEDRSVQAEKEKKKASGEAAEANIRKSREPLLVDRIQAGITAVHGSLGSIEYDGKTDNPRLITAHIPAETFDEFCRMLQDLAEIKNPPHSTGQGKILVKLHLSYEDQK